MAKEKYAILKNTKGTVGLAIAAFIEVAGITVFAEMNRDLPHASVVVVLVMQTASAVVLIFVLFVFILAVWDQLRLG